jgi:hypothetical protein
MTLRFVGHRPYGNRGASPGDWNAPRLNGRREQTSEGVKRAVRTARFSPIYASSAKEGSQIANWPLSRRLARYNLRRGLVLNRVLGLWRQGRGPHGDLDDIVANGVQDQLTHRMQLQLPHDVAAMSLGSLDTQIKMGRYFFCRFPLCKQLHHLAFPWCQDRYGRHSLARAVVSVEVAG